MKDIMLVQTQKLHLKNNCMIPEWKLSIFVTVIPTEYKIY